jgi:uncharacterized protein involved in type VI secretion and phage assembly
VYPVIDIAHAPSAAPRFPGVYRGSVTANDDSTHRGRVQVNVPAVFDLATPDAAVWATPCFPWGHFFVPQVGDKVWVAFEDGDPAAPIWLGTWYARGTAPSDAQASPPLKRLIRSSSGHEVLLDDTQGSAKVVISDAGGSTVTLDQTGITVRDAGGSSIQLAAAGITLKAPGKAIVLQAASVDVQAG